VSRPVQCGHWSAGSRSERRAQGCLGQDGHGSVSASGGAPSLATHSTLKERRATCSAGVRSTTSLDFLQTSVRPQGPRPQVYCRVVACCCRNTCLVISAFLSAPSQMAIKNPPCGGRRWKRWSGRSWPRWDRLLNLISGWSIGDSNPGRPCLPGKCSYVQFRRFEIEICPPEYLPCRRVSL
jgi:hypothetical protein